MRTSHPDPTSEGLSPVERKLGLAEPDRARLRGLYRLNVVYAPVVRLLGFALLSVIVALHDRYVVAAAGPAWLAAGVMVGYALVSWGALRLWFVRSRRVHLGFVFWYADIALFLLAIHWTGGPHSWLFFLLMIRVADHRPATRLRHLLLFAHLPVAGYLLLLLYTERVAPGTFSWAAEVAKLSFIYLANLYLCLAATLPQDLHERVLAAKDLIQELEERTRQLAAARARNALILDSAGEGIFGVDRAGRISFANPAAARLLGWEVGALIGEPFHEVLGHGDGVAGACGGCRICRALAAGEPQRADDEAFRRRDGGRFPVEYVAAPVREENRQVGAVVVFKDDTERREVERMKDEFVSVVSHELRTPLTAIRGSLGLLATGRLGALEERAGEVLGIALSNTDRLMRLINDILDLERMRSGRLSLHPEPVAAGEVLRQAGDLMRPLASEAGVELVVGATEARLRADPDRLVQTVTNLVGNAIKFSPRGSVVELGAEAGAGEVVFRVADQGRGIPAEKLERIFERFEQVDVSDAREHGGSGLGLAICRAIAEQHGGRIWARSEPGRGSTFFVALPTGAPATTIDVPEAEIG